MKTTDQATNKQPYAAPQDTVSEFLLTNCDRILATWIERLRRQVKAARSEDRSVIVDTIPALLENLAQALDQKFPRQLATEGTSIASEHGGERARVTRYTPAEVIVEYQVLRDVIFHILNEYRPLEPSETSIIIQSIDQAMSESLNAYFLVHQGIREQFMMALTHDLRNPLSAIKATTDLMLRYPDRVEQVPHLAARIADNVRRIDRMIQDLLDASRVRFGEKLHFEVQQFDLNAMLQEILAQQSTIYGERFALHGVPVRGYWNRDAFVRAVENLLANAIKYGDPLKPISVRLQEVQGRAIVSVHNEGSAIPIHEQESLFRSFMRTQSARSGKREGWGLGLAMVRGMAEGHGGSITVDSSLERGTTFYIDVPVDTRSHLQHPTTQGV